MTKKPVIKKSVRASSKLKKRKITRPTKKGYAKPQFGSLGESDFETTFDENPELSEGVESDVQEETSAALQAVLDERKQKRDKYRLTNDQKYYFVVCFQSERQKLEFLDKSGLRQCGDDRFLDGLKMAQLLGVDIEAIDLPMRDYPQKMAVRLRKREVIK